MRTIVIVEGATDKLALTLAARRLGRNLEAEDISQIGIVDSYSDFTWKSLFDDFSCTECARCSNFCPAYNTDKPLSPMHLIKPFPERA